MYKIGDIVVYDKTSIVGVVLRVDTEFTNYRYSVRYGGTGVIYCKESSLRMATELEKALYE